VVGWLEKQKTETEGKESDHGREWCLGDQTGLNLCLQEWQVISMHVESTCLVARSLILSARSTSSLARSHICRARANSDCAISISRRVSSRIRSAYAFSIAASRICSAACHFSASTPSHISTAAGGRTLIDSCRSSDGAPPQSVVEEDTAERRRRREESVRDGGRRSSSLLTSSSIGEGTCYGYERRWKETVFDRVVTKERVRTKFP